MKAMFKVCLALFFVAARSKSDADYDKEVASFEKQVASDHKFTQLTSDLLAYAKAAVESNKSAIQANLAGKSLGNIDLLWPGNGYNTQAYGGQYEVLSLLEKDGILTLGNIIGASGGAAGAILALADNDHSSVSMLKYNYIYAESKEAHEQQITAETPLWTAIFRAAIQSDEAFDRVKTRGRVACACGLFWNNDVFYGFTSREQAAKAYYASGDLSVSGVLGGTWIPGFSKVGTCSDGGSVTYFPNSSGALIYFHAFYGYVAKLPDASALDYLFRQGVDDTIRLLTSKELVEKRADGKGGMQMVLPGPSGGVGEKEFSAALHKKDKKSFFHNISAEMGMDFESVVHI